MAKLIFGSLLLLATLAAAPALSGPRSSPPAFMRFLDAIDRGEPLDPQKLRDLLGGDLKCEGDAVRTDCAAHDVRIGEVTVGKVDFRFGRRFGSILDLTDLSGQCVPVDALERKYGPSSLSQSCTDGVLCWDKENKRPWGAFYTRLGKNIHAKCAIGFIVKAP